MVKLVPLVIGGNGFTEKIGGKKNYVFQIPWVRKIANSSTFLHLIFTAIYLLTGSTGGKI